MRSRIIGNSGLILAIFLACAMSAFEFFIGDPLRLEGKLGICMPSPNLDNPLHRIMGDKYRFDNYSGIISSSF